MRRQGGSTTVWDGLEGGAVDALRRQIESDQPAQAWLLLGPSGAGKRAAALSLAAALNCPVRPRVGCGSCRSCERIARGRHPDVHHVAPEGPIIAVDVVRDQIVPEAARSPFEAAFKVFLIEEADRMNPAAQNALLKTVEEPLPDTVFVLISDNEEELLETLRSRCRVVRLEPLSQERISALLLEQGAPGEAAEAAASAAFGDLERARALVFDDGARERRARWASLPERLTSAGAALDAAYEVLDVARGTVKEREVAQREEVVELSEALGEGRGTAAARNALAKRHRRELKRLEEGVLEEALTYLASFLRDVAAARRGAPESCTNRDAANEVARWASSDVTDAELLAAVERCLAARASFVSNANPTLAIEATLVELSRLLALAPPPP
jgi:DNA polymerase-3 subunit delta'